MAHLLEILQKVLDLVPGSTGTVVMVVAILLEFVVRLVPTAKPKSLLLIVSGAIKGVGALLAKVGEIIAKVSALLDAIIQNVKDDPQPPAA